MEPKQTYRDAGVDIDAQDEALRKVRTIVRDTYGPDVVSDIGLFGGLFRARFDGMIAPILVSSADGVGTKLRVAQEMKIHDTVGYDLVCHCVNDILVQGARPLFFLDYFATGKLHPDTMVDVIRGMARGCKENGLALIGGETAEMPGFYRPGEYDVAGFIIGVVDEPQLIDGKKIREGDIILGLPSAGLHTNGYSLARKILFEQEGMDAQSIVPEIGGKVGEVLLAPHLSYLRPILPLVEAGAIHGMAHITGGGLTDNLPRILPEHCDAAIKLGSWEIPPVFRYLQAKGNIDPQEMLRVFNMGIGMALVIAPDMVERVVRRLEAVRQKFYFIGNVIRGNGKVAYDHPPAGFPSWIG
ncbi:MAG TPA: phosphoribosylformylglycinamidine cyclo-ligase [Thermoanaerobaculia bacterium]|nr:phosphoribosylformylglycinamidine cyclo-ligase [Thermoanaerobaculia bacterium]